jgi:hypothetical protein
LVTTALTENSHREDDGGEGQQTAVVDSDGFEVEGGETEGGARYQADPIKGLDPQSADEFEKLPKGEHRDQADQPNRARGAKEYYAARNGSPKQ